MRMEARRKRKIIKLRNQKKKSKIDNEYLVGLADINFNIDKLS